MGGILSGISGYFSKHLILGTFLPTVIFVILGWILVIPSLPSSWPVLKPIESLDPQWKILVFTFVTIVLTGFLYNINVPLIRMYEGYPWQDFWIGQLRTKKYRKLFRVAEAQWKGLPHIEYELYAANDTRLKAIQSLKGMAGGTLVSEFPEREDLLLPTRLGNVIRSFESYSLRQYGMDAVTFWPRLIAEISKDYAAAVDEAKASFDFMLNCSALSGLLSFIIFVTGLLFPASFNRPLTTLVWLAEIISLYAVAYVFYRLSIGRALAWGNTVRTSFDLYRRDLLKHLNYTQVPDSLEAERTIWRNIGKRMVFGDHGLPYVAFVPQKTFVDCKRVVVTFEILRGLAPVADAKPAPISAGVSIEITIRNTSNYDAPELLVTDTLPADFVYCSGSVALTNRDEPRRVPTVSGVNPYTFKVGKLSRRKEMVLRYQARQLQNLPSVTDQEHDEKSSVLLLNGQMVAYHKTGNTHEDDSIQSSAKKE